MSKLTPISADAHGGAWLTLDRYGRIMLSAEVRRELSIVGIPSKLYVSYDPDNERIGIGKPDILRLTDVKPFRVSTRGYIPAQKLIDRYQIDNSVSIRYVFDGKEYADGHGYWLAFKREQAVGQASEQAE